MQPGSGRRAGGLLAGAGRVAGEVDVVRLRGAAVGPRSHQLPDLVRGDQTGVAVRLPAGVRVGVGVEGARVVRVLGGAVDQTGVARSEPDGVRGAARGGDRDRDLGAEVRAAVEGEVALRRGREGIVVGDRVGDDHVRQRRGPVVVLGGLVGGRGHHGDAVPVGVVDGLAGEARVVERAERLLHDLNVVVGRVQHGLGETVDVGDEAVADAQVDDHAVRAGAEIATVVRLGGRVAGLAGSVPVLDVVEGVVVVVEEVPADDVVDVAVVVVVDAVAEGDQHILGLEHAGRTDALRAVGLHAVVAGVVAQVEDAVAVEIPGAVVRVGAGGRAVLAVDVRGRESVVARFRNLALVDAGLEAHVVHDAGVVPLDPRVEHRDRHVGAPGGRHEGGADRRIVVDDVGAANPAELDRVAVGQRVRRVRRRGELELVAAEIAGDLARAEIEIIGVGGVPGGSRVGEGGLSRGRERGGDDQGAENRDRDRDRLRTPSAPPRQAALPAPRNLSHARESP